MGDHTLTWRVRLHALDDSQRPLAKFDPSFVSVYPASEFHCIKKRRPGPKAKPKPGPMPKPKPLPGPAVLALEDGAEGDEDIVE